VTLPLHARNTHLARASAGLRKSTPVAVARPFIHILDQHLFSMLIFISGSVASRADGANSHVEILRDPGDRTVDLKHAD